MSVDKSLFSSMITSLIEKKSFTSEEHHQKCFDIIQRKYAKNEIDNALYIKTFAATFVLHETKDACENSEINPELINDTLKDVDFSRFENIHTIDELMDYILEYYETRIMKKEKFQKVCAILILTFKGLTFPEIDRIVKFEKNEW